MSKNKYLIPAAAVLILLAAGVILFIQLNADPVVRLEIAGHSSEMTKGDAVQLRAVGYTKSGKEASEEQMLDLHLYWEVRFGGICTVDDTGLMTAIGAGTDNVQVYSESYDLYSRPITVFVKDE